VLPASCNPPGFVPPELDDEDDEPAGVAPVSSPGYGNLLLAGSCAPLPGVWFGCGATGAVCAPGVESPGYGNSFDALVGTCGVVCGAGQFEIFVTLPSPLVIDPEQFICVGGAAGLPSGVCFH
jgi:hypothetical protein